uniref:Uncharacterized protein n=1 Tax=Globodera rostochiensis TaxID=31243 RepID=A0A914GTN0_GLORO
MTKTSSGHRVALNRTRNIQLLRLSSLLCAHICFRCITHYNNNKFWLFLALSLVMIMLIVDSQQKMAAASAISELRGIESAFGQQQQKIRKSAGGWVQTYKEPKNGAEAAGQGGRTVRAGTEDEPDDSATERESQEKTTCTIKVQKVEKHTGKCVRLRGGTAACQTEAYLDPVNDDCMFLA